MKCEGLFFEKRILIFHANVSDLPGIPQEAYHDLAAIADQLIELNHTLSWYYYDQNETLQMDFLKTIKKESRKSEQLILMIVGHGAYQDGSYYQLLDQDYCSRDLLNALNKKTATFIYSCGCFSGYFAADYQIPENWIILSRVNRGLDSTYGEIFVDDPLGEIIKTSIIWLSIEAFTAAILNYSTIEEVYSAHLSYLKIHYNNTEYYSSENAPLPWDPDPTQSRIL